MRRCFGWDRMGTWKKGGWDWGMHGYLGRRLAARTETQKGLSIAGFPNTRTAQHK